MIQREAFPITLVFPPQAHFTQPYLALPCLKAWLQEHGFDDVQTLDLSVESYEHFLTPEYLTWAAQRAEERLPFERFGQGSHISFEEMPAFRAAVETRVSAAALIERIEDAKAVLRGRNFFDSESYLPAVRTIYNALRIVSAAHYPSALTPHNFTMRYAIERSAEVLEATLNEAENPYIDWFRKCVLPDLIERRPRLVGLSVIYGSQLIPALTLGRMIKQALPDCHITAGGGFLAYIGDKLMAAPGIEVCLDSIVEHEGERPMEQLAAALRDGTSLEGIDSLTWFDREQAPVKAVANLRGHPITLNEAPLPDFSGLPLELYFSAKVVLPYDVNRGCYHSECTFCTLPTVIGPGYRSRKVTSMVEHLLELQSTHGTDEFYLVTDCMPPATLRELPRELLRQEANITWSCDAKVERKSYQDGGAQLLYDAGCRKLLFGFESVTPRILTMMEKGQTTEDVTFVSRACHEAGISVTWYAMVGFPSETHEEAEATMEFIEQHAGMIQEVSLQNFHVDEVSEVFRTPDRYGVTIHDDPNADLQLYHDYSVSSGMSQEDAAEIHAEARQLLREALPIFSGENVLYFMQKSHYYLHLARGASPTEFAEQCKQREASRESREVGDKLMVSANLEFLPIPFSHSTCRRALGSRLARAARPENQTGSFDAQAAQLAGSRVPPLARESRVLIYVADEAEFLELHPDGVIAIDALRKAGSLGELRRSIASHSGSGPSAREHLDRFAGALQRSGVLSP
ncbi:MAG: anaerobic magnesium-protoporphyrin IX monomethyl ester cyclase [Candidatus Paceibacteria bacterium]|jgi:anaerobic magnesium-protoporphyrin IX monomethyl ester cyclase